MRVYISGAITGPLERGEDFAEPFRKRAFELKKMGYSPVNPLDYQKTIIEKHNGNPSHADYMNELLKVLLECEGISMLDNWIESEGAECEKYVAEETGKIFVEVKML